MIWLTNEILQQWLEVHRAINQLNYSIKQQKEKDNLSAKQSQYLCHAQNKKQQNLTSSMPIYSKSAEIKSTLSQKNDFSLQGSQNIKFQVNDNKKNCTNITEKTNLKREKQIEQRIQQRYSDIKQVEREKYQRKIIPYKKNQDIKESSSSMLERVPERQLQIKSTITQKNVSPIQRQLEKTGTMITKDGSQTSVKVLPQITLDKREVIVQKNLEYIQKNMNQMTENSIGKRELDYRKTTQNIQQPFVRREVVTKRTTEDTRSIRKQTANTVRAETITNKNSNILIDNKQMYQGLIKMEEIVSGKNIQINQKTFKKKQIQNSLIDKQISPFLQKKEVAFSNTIKDSQICTKKMQEGRFEIKVCQEDIKLKQKKIQYSVDSAKDSFVNKQHPGLQKDIEKIGYKQREILDKKITHKNRQNIQQYIKQSDKNIITSIMPIIRKDFQKQYQHKEEAIYTTNVQKNQRPLQDGNSIIQQNIQKTLSLKNLQDQKSVNQKKTHEIMQPNQEFIAYKQIYDIQRGILPNFQTSLTNVNFIVDKKNQDIKESSSSMLERVPERQLQIKSTITQKNVSPIQRQLEKTGTMITKDGSQTSVKVLPQITLDKREVIVQKNLEYIQKNMNQMTENSIGKRELDYRKTTQNIQQPFVRREVVTKRTTEDTRSIRKQTANTVRAETITNNIIPINKDNTVLDYAQMVKYQDNIQLNGKNNQKESDSKIIKNTNSQKMDFLLKNEAKSTDKPILRGSSETKDSVSIIKHTFQQHTRQHTNTIKLQHNQIRIPDISTTFKNKPQISLKDNIINQNQQNLQDIYKKNTMQHIEEEKIIFNEKGQNFRNKNQLQTLNNVQNMQLDKSYNLSTVKQESQYSSQSPAIYKIPNQAPNILQHSKLEIQQFLVNKKQLNQAQHHILSHQIQQLLNIPKQNQQILTIQKPIQEHPKNQIQQTSNILNKQKKQTQLLSNISERPLQQAQQTIYIPKPRQSQQITNVSKKYKKQIQQPSVETKERPKASIAPIKFNVQDTTGNFNELLFQIKNAVLDCSDQYGLLSPAIFQQLFSDCDQFYYRPNQVICLITHLVEYLSECKNRLLPNPTVPTAPNFFYQLGEKVSTLQDKVFFQNKSILKTMSYLSADSEGGYLDLKFALDADQVMAVAVKTRELFKEDSRAFFFLTHYLLSSCVNLEKQGQNFIQIEQAVTKALNDIKNRFLVSQQTLNSEENMRHPNYKIENLPQLLDQIDLSYASNKREAFHLFIVKRINEAKNCQPKFIDLIEEICVEKGTNFRIETKISEQSNKVIDKLKRETLASYLTKYTLTDYVKSEREQKLQLFIEWEESKISSQIAESYSKVQQPIIFKVSDMLKAICVFRKTEDINECVDKLKKKISEAKDVRFIGLTNRLQGINKALDVVVHVLIGQTMGQVQLSLLSDSDFFQNIYQIVSSKDVNPLTILSNMNQQLKKEFLEEVSQCFAANNAHSTQQRQKEVYQTKYTFKSLQENLQHFSTITKFQAQSLRGRDKAQEASFSILKQKFYSINRLKPQSALPESEKSKIMKNSGEYLSGSNKPQLSFQSFQKYFAIAERALESAKQFQEIPQMQMKMGRQKQQKGDFKNALILYEKSVSNLQSASKTDTLDLAQSWKRIGTVNYNLGYYEKGLQYFNKCLKIQEEIKGHQSIETANTLNNIGLVHASQTNQSKAIQYYQKCLAIQQRVKGKKTIDCAPTLNNIGQAYCSQGDYQKAFQYCNKSLQLWEGAKGKMTIHCVPTLSNIGIILCSVGDHANALQYHLKCLEIRERVKGKKSIDCVSTLKNMALVYDQQKDYQKAVECYQRTLQIEETVKGKGTADTTAALYEIGTTHFKQGNYEKAQSNLIKCLKAQEKLFGKYSLKCAITQNQIGQALIKRRNYEKALEYLNKCLQIHDKLKGKDSAESAPVIHNLAAIYKFTGKAELADECQKRHKSILQKHKK